MKRNYIKGIISVLIASMCYGITPILSKFVLNGGMPATFVHNILGSSAEILCENQARMLPNECVVGISMGIACIISLILCLVTKKSIKITKKQVFQLALCGGAARAAMLLLISYAYLRIPSGLAVIITFTYPVFVVLERSLFFKEKFTPTKLILLVMAVAGIALMSNDSIHGKIDFAGILLALMAGIAYSVYFIAGRDSAYTNLDSSVSNFYIALFACIVCFIVSIITKRIQLPADFVMWLILTSEAFIGNVIALRLLLNGIKLLGSATASALNTIEPVFVLLASMLIFDEKVGLLKGIGIFLVVLSAIIGICSMQHKALET